MTWEVYALKYSERNGRTRADSFIFDDHHSDQHDMDYFVWVVRNEHRTILVDTGYDTEEAMRRGRPTLREPMAAIGALGLSPDDIDEIVVTHLHYDHAGGLRHFPNARIHIQEAEVAFATGPCMCHPEIQAPYTADHVCEVIKRVYSGRVIFHDGDAGIADGITLHHIGGHSRGLQALGIQTASGTLCLASDAAHYYENFEQGKLFPLVVDAQEMLDGFKRLRTIASRPELIIPGHDPLVRERFPQFGESGFVYRLD